MSLQIGDLSSLDYKINMYTIMRACLVSGRARDSNGIVGEFALEIFVLTDGDRKRRCSLDNMVCYYLRNI